MKKLQISKEINCCSSQGCNNTCCQSCKTIFIAFGTFIVLVSGCFHIASAKFCNDYEPPKTTVIAGQIANLDFKAMLKPLIIYLLVAGIINIISALWNLLTLCCLGKCSRKAIIFCIFNNLIYFASSLFIPIHIILMAVEWNNLNSSNGINNPSTNLSNLLNQNSLSGGIDIIFNYFTDAIVGDIQNVKIFLFLEVALGVVIFWWINLATFFYWVFALVEKTVEGLNAKQILPQYSNDRLNY